MRRKRKQDTYYRIERHSPCDPGSPRIRSSSRICKKHVSSNIASSDLYKASVHSFTHGNTNDVVVSKKFLSLADRVLIIDDFLANGEALKGLIDICAQASATVVGCGIAIEKAFQGGGDKLRKLGVRIVSLARIASMTDNEVVFCR